MFTSRASLSDLAGLARRVAISSKAGVDIRTILSGEAQRAPFQLRAPLKIIAEAVAQGETLTDAFKQTGDAFPTDFHELITISDQTGALPEVLVALANHYDRLITFKRDFFRSISWPAIQLFISILVIGLFIYILGFISPGSDPLGFGLVGAQGLVLYCTAIFTIGLSLFILYKAAMNGALWMKPVQYFILATPLLGSSLRTLAVSQFATFLSLTLAAGVEIRRAVGLALRSTHMAPFTDLQSKLHQVISDGQELHVGLKDCPIFPQEFVDAVAVGEEAGSLPETMENIAKGYRDLAYVALGNLTQIAAAAVWVAVAGAIIFCIFKIFTGMYLGVIQENLPQ